MQNFRAKPGTAMQAAPEPDDEEFLAAVATARVVLGPHMHLQAPPNLSDPAQQVRLLDAGIDDWGGVSPLTPDHVNPEKPWPSIEALTATTASRGKQLRERLTIYPAFAAKPDPVPRRQDAGSRDRRLARARWPGRRRAASGTDRVAGPRRPVEAADDRAHLRQGRRTRASAGTPMTVYGDADTPRNHPRVVEA